MKVILLVRKPRPSRYSVERVFESVLAAMPPDIDAEIVRLPYESQGLVGRLGNLLFTARLRADVVHVTGDVHYCALAVRRSRCVLTVLDLVSMHRLKGIRKALLVLLWYRLPVAWSTCITTISQASLDELVELAPRSAAKTVVIPCPVSPEFLGSRRAQTRGARFQVLVVGTGPNKNIERVAEALSGLGVDLRIIGSLDAKQIETLRDLQLKFSSAENLSNEGLLREFYESDLLIFASTYEGFGLPIVEAHATGLPVITSRLPPMSDVAGGAAVLVDPYSVESIRIGVVDIINGGIVTAELVEAGYRNSRRFSPQTVAEAYAYQYRLLIN